MTPEKAFETAFAYACKAEHCLYVKIPDAIMTKVRLVHIRQTGRSDEPKKPFDGIMVTPAGNLCLEFKYQYGKLRPHQLVNQQAINDINNSFVVVRLKETAKAQRFYAEYGEYTTEFGNIKDLVFHLLNYAIINSGRQ